MLGMAAGLLAGVSCGPRVFECASDDECQNGADNGLCVAGFCAFPDNECDSGLRYGEHAGRLSGTCVLPDAGAETLGTEGPDFTSTSGGTMGSATSTPGSGPGSGPDTQGSGPDSSDDGPGPGEVEFTDDEYTGEFEAGQFAGTQWADGRLGLELPAVTGTFTSRVFDAGAVAQWQTAQWQPDAPYGKPLPDDGAAERGYVEGGVDMANNVLLMHFDGEGVWGDGVDVSDASGAGSHGTIISDAGPVPLIAGVFDTAIDDHLESRVSIPTAQAPALAFGENDFTWALWFRMDDPCEQNHVYMGVDNDDDGTSTWPHLWLGCTDDSWGECSGMVTEPRGAGVFRSQHSVGDDGAFFCSQSSINGNEWHHMVVTKEGHNNASVRLYLDGQLEYQGTGSFAGPLEYPDEPDFTIGAFSRGSYPAEAAFDEAAAWSRALGTSEVAAAYHRGVLRLQVSVRVCDEPECADEPSFGQVMVDPPDSLTPGSVLNLEGLGPGRYVQYQVEMSRSAGDDAFPRLGSITLRGVL